MSFDRLRRSSSRHYPVPRSKLAATFRFAPLKAAEETVSPWVEVDRYHRPEMPIRCARVPALWRGLVAGKRDDCLWWLGAVARTW